MVSAGRGAPPCVLGWTQEGLRQCGDFGGDPRRWMRALELWREWPPETVGGRGEDSPAPSGVQAPHLAGILGLLVTPPILWGARALSTVRAGAGPASQPRGKEAMPCAPGML